MPSCPIDKNVFIPPYSSGCGCDRESSAAIKTTLDQYVIFDQLPAVRVVNQVVNSNGNSVNVNNGAYGYAMSSSDSLLSIGCNCSRQSR